MEVITFAERENPRISIASKVTLILPLVSAECAKFVSIAVLYYKDRLIVIL